MKKGPGRQKRLHAVGNRVFENMPAAEVLTGIPVAEQKVYRSAGCLAFRNSKIYEKELLAWRETHGAVPTTGELIVDPLKAAQTRKLDLDHEIKLGKYELKDKVKESFAKAMEGIQKVLLTFLDKTTYNKVIREMKRELEALDL